MMDAPASIELEELRRELARIRPIYTAACAWLDAQGHRPMKRTTRQLIAAIKAAQALAK